MIGKAKWVLNHVTASPSKDYKSVIGAIYWSLYPSASLRCHCFDGKVDFRPRPVPDLYEASRYSFYWGNLDRHEAEQFLDKEPNGTFLLRAERLPDMKPNERGLYWEQQAFYWGRTEERRKISFFVSFKRDNRSHHAQVKELERNFRLDFPHSDGFKSDTVCGLVEHYMEHPSSHAQPMLTIPLHRPFVFPLREICRAVICSCVNYDGISCMAAKGLIPFSCSDFLGQHYYIGETLEWYRRLDITNAVVNEGALQVLPRLLQYPNLNVNKEAAWTISNIIDGNPAQIRTVLDSGCLTPLISMLENSQYECQKEALFAVTNLMIFGTVEEVTEVCKAGAVKPICDLFSVKDGEILPSLLVCIENILKMGEKVNHQSLVLMIKNIKNLKEAAKIIEKYFPGEDEEDENILLNHVAPRVGNEGFVFETNQWESVNYHYEKRHGYPHGYRF